MFPGHCKRCSSYPRDWPLVRAGVGNNWLRIYRCVGCFLDLLYNEQDLIPVIDYIEIFASTGPTL
jgi:hypothetical protein